MSLSNFHNDIIDITGDKALSCSSRDESVPVEVKAFEQINGSLDDDDDHENTTDIQLGVENESSDSDIDLGGEFPGKNTTKSSLVVTKEDFYRRLHETESKDDLELLYPPSLWKEAPSNAIKDEQKILQALQTDTTGKIMDEWYEIDLTNFCVYNCLTHKKYPGQYESLHNFATGRTLSNSYLLDGTATCGHSSINLRSAVIHKVSIGGRDSGSHSYEDIWVQTKDSMNANAWYKLKRPSNAYQNIWKDFCWVANFAKYCLDYLSHADDTSRQVTLKEFRSDFMDQIAKLHDNAPEFQKWLSMAGYKTDVRRYLTQFGYFVYDQYYDISQSINPDIHPLWNEIGLGVVYSDRSRIIEKTLVTRNVTDTFLSSFPGWGAEKHDLLEQMDCIATVEKKRQQRLRCLRLSSKFSDQSRNFQNQNGGQISKVEWIRQKAALTPQNGSLREATDLVQKLVLVRQKKRGKLEFNFALVLKLTNDRKHVRVVWLIAPLDTICCSAKGGKQKLYAGYPIGNELFYSDKCNCFSVEISDIVGIYSISTSFEGRHKTDFFVITKYCEGERCFVNPDLTSDFVCRVHYPNVGGHCLKSEGQGSNHHAGQLANVSLFSGCGLFDRALESSGALKTALSIDYNAYAVRSAAANRVHIQADSDTSPEFIVSSVNTELRKIMNGKRPFPESGSLSAGNPCPGFSNINSKKTNTKGQRDCSLLAATMSWVEILLPAYIVIENVIGMDSGSPSACSQAISFLVTLGYQVRKFCLEATDFGGCTMRKRLFILAAAPAFNLPQAPKPSHGDRGGSSLKATVTIRNAISDLNPVHNDTVVNISEPYHIPMVRFYPNVNKVDGANFRDLIRRIPTTPPGLGVVDAKDLLNKTQKMWFDRLLKIKRAPNSKVMRRIEPDDYFRTVVARINWVCGFTGQVMHYDQHRMVTLEEMARAQGVPSDFVLVGTLNQKLYQIGNAVPWCFREALGNEIRKAYWSSRPMEAVMAESAPLGQETTTKITEEAQDGDDDEIIFGTEAEFEQARAGRKRSRSLDAADEEHKKIQTKK